MGISNKVRTDKSTPQGKPTIKAGPSQTAKIVTPKKNATAGKGC